MPQEDTSLYLAAADVRFPKHQRFCFLNGASQAAAAAALVASETERASIVIVQERASRTQPTARCLLHAAPRRLPSSSSRRCSIVIRSPLR